jgi:hypothetical protein
MLLNSVVILLKLWMLTVLRQCVHCECTEIDVSNAMQEIPSETNSCSAGQESSCIL